MIAADFWPWWIGGLLTAAIVVGYPAVTRLSLGVSALFPHLLKELDLKKPELAATDPALEAALLAATLAQFGPSEAIAPAPVDPSIADEIAHERARGWFFPGLLLGGVAWGLLNGPKLTLSLGSALDARYGSSPLVVGGSLLLGGALIGFGTRMSGALHQRPRPEWDG